MPYERAQWREVRTLSGGEQKRLVLEALLRGPDEVLMLDEPDNYLDVPAKRWLEEQLLESAKTVLFVSHDRELLARTATRIVTLEPGPAGSTAWTHGGGFATYHQAREDRILRLEELRRRWDEEHAKLKALVADVPAEGGVQRRHGQPAAGGDDPAARSSRRPGRRRSAAASSSVKMRLRGGRTGKRALICEQPRADRADEAVRPRGLVRRAGRGARAPTARASRTSCGCWPRGGTDPDVEHRPVEDLDIAPVAHTGRARLGARVRPGWFAQTHEHPELAGRTLLEILHRGDEHRDGMGREQAARALRPLRAGAAPASRPSTRSPAASRPGCRSCCWSCPARRCCCSTSRPTTSTWHSAEALEEGLDAFEGTVLAVTHDRWFARGFDRFLVFGADGEVYEAPSRSGTRAGSSANR